MKPCKTCKHSARCLPNQATFPQLLFIDVCKRTLCLCSNIARAKEYRKALLKELPESCPLLLLPSGVKRYVQVHCKSLTPDTVEYVLIWPKPEMLGAFSIGSHQV